MARKRLSAPFGDREPLPPEGVPDTPPASRPPGLSAPPISRVAGEAATAAALDELAGEMARARAEGRMVEVIPIAAVEAGHLVRDRVGLDEEELAALMESLRQHGQRAPIEVIELAASAEGGRRYGLISGWRRLTALSRLRAETGEARFATVLAFLRRPEAAAEAYVAMVEENEIRADLSYYERARIAAKAVEAGAFPDRTAALRALYATASRSKRSKIGSFLVLHDALEAALRFPAAIGERLGLALAARLEADPGFAAALKHALAVARPPSAAEEGKILLQMLTSSPGAASRPTEEGAPSLPSATELAPGIWLSERMTGRTGRLGLSGPGVTPALRKALVVWLSGWSGGE